MAGLTLAKSGPQNPTGQTDQNIGANAWPGWEVMVLHDLGAPASADNIHFLDLWHSYEKSVAQNNPLNLTGPPGSGSINSQGVQNYSTRQQGAQLTANNIMNYPTIYSMLKGNNVKGVLFNNGSLQKLVSDLNKWGSKSFANNLSGGESVVTKTENAIASPFHDITSAWNWVGQNWDRILFVIGGGILLILGALFLFKSQSGGNTFTFDRGE